MVRVPKSVLVGSVRRESVALRDGELAATVDATARARVQVFFNVDRARLDRALNEFVASHADGSQAQRRKQHAAPGEANRTLVQRAVALLRRGGAPDAPAEEATPPASTDTEMGSVLRRQADAIFDIGVCMDASSPQEVEEGNTPVRVPLPGAVEPSSAASYSVVLVVAGGGAPLAENEAVAQITMASIAGDRLAVERQVAVAPTAWHEVVDVFGMDDPAQAECVVCLTEPRSTVLLPCRHLCVCESCFSHSMALCPICRAPARAFLRFREAGADS